MLALAACGGAPPPAPPLASRPVPAPPVCGPAAVGLAHVDAALRAPGTSGVIEIQRLCEADGWPGEAVDCFRAMTGADDLAGCAQLLPDEPRARLLAELARRDDDASARTTLGVAFDRLTSIHVGIAECDLFVAAVALVLRCEPMPVTSRAELGMATADTWSISAHALSSASRARMATVCTQALASLSQQSAQLGCP